MNLHVKKRALLAVLVMVPVLVATAQVRDLGLSRSADVVLALDIPEEVSLKVDGEFIFDLGRVQPGGSGDPCTDRFPPPSRCAFAFYNPTSVTFKEGLATGAASEARSALISIVDNLPSGTLHVRHSISAEWSGGEPGIPTSAMQSAPAAGVSARRDSFRPIPTAPEEFLSVAAPLGPTRIDRILQLVLPRDTKISATARPVTARITYEVFHSPS
jgi:hypothetical protein